MLFIMYENLALGLHYTQRYMHSAHNTHVLAQGPFFRVSTIFIDLRVTIFLYYKSIKDIFLLCIFKLIEYVANDRRYLACLYRLKDISKIFKLIFRQLRSFYLPFVGWSVISFVINMIR